MNTKLLMTASSLFMGAIGLTLSFAPEEVLETIGQGANAGLTLILQLAGALYFGFAMLNWMAKTVLIGGIYARPVSLGNFSHFAIAGLALLKAVWSNDTFSVYIFLPASIYILFAVLFGYVLFTSPEQRQTTLSKK